jgi:hypothetical protein
MAIGTQDWGDTTPITLTFGVVLGGEQQSSQIRVRSNGSFRVFAQSLNGQKMAHTIATNPSTVPYFFHFNGSPADLSSGSPVEVLSFIGKTDLTGITYPFTVTIGDISLSGIGDHTDTIVFTMSDY